MAKNLEIQDLEILSLKANDPANGLIPAALDTSHLPKNYHLSQVTKYLDNPSRDKKFPKKVHEFFKEVKQACFIHFENKSKMTKAADKIISAITAKETQGKVIAFATPAEKKFLIGSHEIQKTVADKLNATIASIQLDAAKKIQKAISDHITTDLLPAIQTLDVKQEIIKDAKDKWIALHGGVGKPNFFDAVYLVKKTTNLDLTLGMEDDALPGGDPGLSSSRSSINDFNCKDCIFRYSIFVRLLLCTSRGRSNKS
jgi:hypothetical protein